MSEQVLKDSIKSATEVQVLKVVLVNHAGINIDCSELWVNIEIYESIYNNVLTGSITINDTINMIRNAPVIGKEKVEITFKTPSTDSIVKKFSVYDMSMKQRLPGKMDVIYTLQFASMQYEINYKKKVSKAFKNTKISEIVRKIFNNYLVDKNSKSSKEESKIQIIEDTSEPTTLVIPNWSPIQAINWLAKKAERYGNYDYMFYETMEGFFFAPLSALKSSNATTTYQYTHEPTKDGSGKNVDREMRKITTFLEIQNGCNKNELEMEGVFSSLGISHDITFKNIEYNLFSYIQDYQNPDTVSLSREPIVPLTTVRNLSPETKVDYFQKNSFAHNNMKQQYNIFASQKRISQLLRNNAKMLKLEFPGDSRRRAGEVINVEILSAEFLKSKEDSSILDGSLSGRYLVVSVGHHITKSDGYHMGIEVVRDSFEEAYPDTVQIGNST